MKLTDVLTKKTAVLPFIFGTLLLGFTGCGNMTGPGSGPESEPTVSNPTINKSYAWTEEQNNHINYRTIDFKNDSSVTLTVIDDNIDDENTNTKMVFAGRYSYSDSSSEITVTGLALTAYYQASNPNKDIFAQLTATNKAGFNEQESSYNTTYFYNDSSLSADITDETTSESYRLTVYEGSYLDKWKTISIEKQALVSSMFTTKMNEGSKDESSWTYTFNSSSVVTLTTDFTDSNDNKFTFTYEGTYTMAGEEVSRSISSFTVENLELVSITVNDSEPYEITEDNTIDNVIDQIVKDYETTIAEGDDSTVSVDDFKVFVEDKVDENKATTESTFEGNVTITEDSSISVTTEEGTEVSFEKEAAPEIILPVFVGKTYYAYPDYNGLCILDFVTANKIKLTAIVDGYLSIFNGSYSISSTGKEVTLGSFNLIDYYNPKDLTKSLINEGNESEISFSNGYINEIASGNYSYSESEDKLSMSSEYTVYSMSASSSITDTLDENGNPITIQGETVYGEPEAQTYHFNFDYVTDKTSLLPFVNKNYKFSNGNDWEDAYLTVCFDDKSHCTLIYDVIMYTSDDKKTINQTYQIIYEGDYTVSYKKNKTISLIVDNNLKATKAYKNNDKETNCITEFLSTYTEDDIKLLYASYNGDYAYNNSVITHLGATFTEE